MSTGYGTFKLAKSLPTGAPADHRPFEPARNLPTGVPTSHRAIERAKALQANAPTGNSVFKSGPVPNLLRTWHLRERVPGEPISATMV